jgi:hypothetical protein
LLHGLHSDRPRLHLQRWNARASVCTPAEVRHGDFFDGRHDRVHAREQERSLFWPLDLNSDGGSRFAPAYPAAATGRPLRIVHAANHRMFKGTRYLETAVRELRQEGEDIELVLVEGVPNSKALELYRSGDVIFDQCLIGFHGYFALEAMALGKPVLCYIRKREYLLAPDECPIVNVCAATLKDDLRRVIQQRERLNEIGRAGRAYVEKHFTPEAFARRLERAYRELGVAA